MAEVQVDVAPEAPAVPEKQPKNVERLTRSFRKAKKTVPKRSWHQPVLPTPSGTMPFIPRCGVPVEAVEALVQSLTEEERTRAESGLNPLSSLEMELAKRATRFGLTLPSASVPIETSPEILQQRQARFGTAPAAVAPVVLSEEDRLAIEARMKRFGGSSA